MIELAGVELNDNLTLAGIETARVISAEKKWSLDGYLHVNALALANGEELTLGTTDQDGKRQGVWCKSQIDLIKAAQALAAAVVLNYRETYYNVLIADTSELNVLYQSQLEGPNKKYVGRITLIKV